MNLNMFDYVLVLTNTVDMKQNFKTENTSESVI